MPLLLGWPYSWQQRVRWQEEICPYFTRWCLSQACLGAGCPRCCEGQDEPLLCAVKYERIARRRGKKRVIIAIARMILTAIYSVLSTRELWNPVDLFKVDMPDHLKEQQRAKAVKQAIRFLETQGLKVG